MSVSSTIVRSRLETLGDETLFPQSQHVPLHDLCKNCADFCGRWDVLDWLQRTDSGLGSKRPVEKLCTIEHLAENQGGCHLCTFLVASFQREVNKVFDHHAELNVYLQPQPKEDGVDQYVHATVAKEALIDAGVESVLSKTFMLKKHNRKPFRLPMLFVI